MTKASVTVNKLPSSVTTAPTAVTNLVYNGAEQELVTAGVASGGTMQYSTDGTNYSADIPTGIAAGDYTVHYKVDGGDTNEGTSAVAIENIVIAQKPVTITGLSVDNKEYDGGTTATVTGTATVSDKVGEDDVSVTGGSAAFADKNVGTGKTVTFSGYTLTGAAAGNYTLSAQPASTTANITAKSVTITGLSVENKTYDGSATATVTGTATVSGKIGEDAVSVTAGSAAFADEFVDTGKTVTFSGYSLTGNDAGNYSLSAQPASTTADITAATQTITAKENTLSVIKGGTISAAELAANITGAQGVLTFTASGNGGTMDNGAFKAGDTPNTTATISATAAAKDLNNDDKPEYSASSPVTFTVNVTDKYVPTVTLSGVPASKTYGDADFTVTASATNNGTASGNWTWSTSDDTTFQLTQNGASVSVKILKANTSGATITATYESDTHRGSATSAAITVAKATPTVTAPTAKKLTYTGEAQALVNAGSTNGGELQYSLSENDTYSTDIPTATNADSYTVWYKVVGDGNYNDVAARSVTVTINKATPDGAVVVKDGAPTFYNSDAISVLKSNLQWNGTKPAAADGDTITLTETQLTVGTTAYHWTYTSANTNYNTKSGTVSVTVVKNDLTSLTVTGTPTKATYEYNDAFEPADLTVTAVFANGTKTVVTADDGVTFNGGNKLTTIGDEVPVTVSYTNNGVTKTATVNVKVTKKALSVAGMSWSGSTTVTFDGSEHSLTLAGTLPTGVTATQQSGDKTTDAGSYTATVTFALASGYSDANYEITGTNPLTQAWTIKQATGAAGSTDFKVRFTNTADQTVDLAAFIPSNAGEIKSVTVAATTDASSIIASVSGDKTAKTATFKLADSIADATPTADLTATIATKNYTDIVVTINVALSAKDVPVVTAQDITKTYDGKAVTDADIKGTAKFEGANVDGTWKFDGTPAKTNAGEGGKLTVIFTPTDTATYDTASVVINVTINKATLSGTPAFTAVSEAGKTLADVLANSTLADTFKGVNNSAVSGAFAWNDADTTEVTRGTAYGWTFTPSQNNYNTVTGNYTPWPNPTYVPSTPTGGGSSSTDKDKDKDKEPAEIFEDVTAKVEAEKDADGGYTATITDDDMEDIKSALEHISEGGEFVIQPDVAEDAEKVTVTLPASAVEDLADSRVGEVTVTTPVAEVTITSDGLSSIADEADKTVSVTAERNEDGTVTVDITADDKVVTEVEGGVTVKVPTTETGSGVVAIVVNEDGSETVVRQSVVVEGKLVTPLAGSATIKIVDNTKKFVDVPGHWAEANVNFVSARELFKGTSDTEFSPEANMTRGMMATVLFRLDGEHKGDVAGSFFDVENDFYYTDAIAWAHNKTIVTGYEDNSFMPAKDITREELAAMVYRYAQQLGYGFKGLWMFNLDYTDSSNISSWAYESVCWLTMNGILNGRPDGTIDPNGLASRAEVSAVLERLVEFIAK